MPDKYSVPCIVNAFFDTGAVKTITNPKILPKEFWKPYKCYFKTVGKTVFCTKLKSKPVKIQYFPGCSIWYEFLGLTLPTKDIVVGFDLYKAILGL